MEVRVDLTPDEVKTAIKNYVNTQGMNLSDKSVEFNDKNQATVICEKQRTSSGFNYMDR